MRSEVVHEPAALGVVAFMMYLASMAVPLALASLGQCGWRGACDAPLAEFMSLMVLHWVIIGFVLKRSVALARLLMLPLGVLPFLLVIFGRQAVGLSSSYAGVIGVYLLLFGVCFTAYLFLSPEVQRYVVSQRSA